MGWFFGKKKNKETETKVEEKKETVVAEKEEPKQEEKVEETTVETSEGTEEKTSPVRKKNYHVSLRAEDGKWQVKFANGKKALKLFDTQLEAIAYAKELAASQDALVTIHKTDGKIRKQDYSKK